MKVLRVIDEMVEIFWIDDNEIEFMDFICIDEIITSNPHYKSKLIAKYGIEKSRSKKF
jgi:hypothetical protein